MFNFGLAIKNINIEKQLLMSIENFRKKIKAFIVDNEFNKAFFHLKKEVNSFSPHYQEIKKFETIFNYFLQNEEENSRKIQVAIFKLHELLDQLQDSDLKQNTSIWKRILGIFQKQRDKNKEEKHTPFNPNYFDNEIIKDKMNVKPRDTSPSKPVDDLDRVKEKMDNSGEEEEAADENQEEKGLFDGFLNRLKDIFIKSNKGKIVCSIPRVFQNNMVNTVVVRLSRKELSDSILESGLENSNLEKGKIELGKVMVVEIFEPTTAKNFEITALNNIEQVIDLSKNEFKEWQYHIKPTRQGVFTLIIRVSILKNIDGIGAKKEDLMVWCKEVQVATEDVNDAMDSIIFGRSWGVHKPQKLKMKIANNKYGEVFQDLANVLQFEDISLFNRLVAIQNRWHQILNDKRKGLLENDEFSADITGVGTALLIMINIVSHENDLTKINKYKAELTRIEGLIAA